jgi:hypothetical protein
MNLAQIRIQTKLRKEENKKKKKIKGWATDSTSGPLPLPYLAQAHFPFPSAQPITTLARAVT